MACLLLLAATAGAKRTYRMADYGLVPGTGENVSGKFTEALRQILNEARGSGGPVHIVLKKGRYDFHEAGSTAKEYYISNHDQQMPKRVGLLFEGLKDVVFDGQGSELVFHGRMLPVALTDARNCTLKNFSIDFEIPHISQATVVANDTVRNEITYRLDPWVKYELRDSTLYSQGEGWEHASTYGIAFEPGTRRLVYTSSDIWISTKRVVEIAPRTFRAPWRNRKLVPGTVLAMRGPGRPCPAVFMYRDTDTRLENIHVYYAEGMGLLAQMCDNIWMDDFSVRLRGKHDPRYFTAQADATHFSGCRGVVSCVNSLFEGMMDDAINVHGVYLRVLQRLDDRTLVAENKQPGSYGFEWGRPGDRVDFLRSRTMEVAGHNTLQAIEAVDAPTYHGAKQFRLTFAQPLDTAIRPENSIGIENLTWTPEVYFAHNIVRNNRARGALFSTPKRTVVEHNLFDHTSGAAILLCGDCNGWYETGACHNVVIRKNRFVNALTNMFQFTNAVISIYPVIPELNRQRQYFHSGIVIENNRFDTFDRPLLYAKSVDGLTFRNNVVKQNTDYPAFHKNNRRFWLQHVRNIIIEGNRYSDGYDPSRDYKEE